MLEIGTQCRVFEVQSFYKVLKSNGAHVSPGRPFRSPKFRVWPFLTLEGSFWGNSYNG